MKGPDISIVSSNAICSDLLKRYSTAPTYDERKTVLSSNTTGF